VIESRPGLLIDDLTRWLSTGGAWYVRVDGRKNRTLLAAEQDDVFVSTYSKFYLNLGGLGNRSLVVK
jgi:hypothetical protein